VIAGNAARNISSSTSAATSRPTISPGPTIPSTDVAIWLEKSTLTPAGLASVRVAMTSSLTSCATPIASPSNMTTPIAVLPSSETVWISAANEISCCPSSSCSFSIPRPAS
jgi:hypothetical protein